MKALRFSEEKGLRVEEVPVPEPASSEALIKIIRAGVCSTDLEIIRGYVPGFNFTLGHEFVGVVEQAPGNPELIGRRVVGEINCKCAACNHPEPIFVRNHAPERTVLGIIGKDGCMAEYCTLPLENLHLVPDDVSDAEACFTEPLAAACRIVEQHAVRPGDSIAVIGDGKLGLLVAHVLARQHENDNKAPGVPPSPPLTFLGRHKRKLDLVEGVNRIVVQDSTAADLAGKFDVVVEASGSPQGITLAAALTRPLGTIVQKSTCSTVVTDPRTVVQWSTIANDVVVNEKKVIGSRCGPFPPALELLRNEMTKRLVKAMLDAEVALEEGVEGIDVAQRKGALKVQLVCSRKAAGTLLPQ